MQTKHRFFCTLSALGLCLGLSRPASAVSSTEMSPAANSAQTQSAQPLTVQSLLKQLAQCPGLEASYREEKEMSLLSVPLKSHGKVYFARPNLLSRHTLAPEKSTVVLNGDKLSFTDPGGHHELDLKDRPVLRSFASSFSQVLAGDLAGLEKTYSLSFATKPATDKKSKPTWSLQLVPKAAQLAKLLKSLSLEGQGIEIKTMILREKNGDITTTRFDKINTERKFTPTQLKSLFLLSAS